MNEVLKNPQKEDELSNTVGEWVIYEQGGDHAPLVESLGNKTRWSVEDPSKAKYQLKIGDIIVYYTGPKRIPRALIRMESNHIADVIGVAEDQNLDPYIEDIVSRKLKEFGEEGESYKTKVSDMKRVTGICDRVNKGGDLDSEDLRFLYEIDRTIQGFEYSRDPRINTLLEGRDIKKDLSLATGYSQDEISITKEEALSGNIKFHYGDLDLNDLNDLSLAEGLELPEKVGGSLSLNGLSRAEGLKLPEKVGGSLSLNGLSRAEGLKLPKEVGRNLYLNGLSTGEGLELSAEIGGGLYLNGLSTAKYLKLPEIVNGHLYLNGLSTAKYLKLPEIVNGHLYLNGLSTAKELKLPKKVNGSLVLNGLLSVENLELPEIVNGNLYLSGLSRADGLNLPKIVGSLILKRLQSAKGLKFPEVVNGDLDLSGLSTTEGLILSRIVLGYIDLKSLPPEEKQQLKLKYPDHIIE